MSVSRFTEACTKFAESERLESGIGTLLWLGECLQKTDKQASAYRTFQKAAALARARGDDRETVASTRAARLASTVPRWTIVANAGASRESINVAIDGASIPRSQWGVAAMIDAGEYELAFTEPGHLSELRTLHVDAAAQITVIVPDLAARPTSAAPHMLPAAGTNVRVSSLDVTRNAPPPPSADYWHPRRVVGVSLAAAGAVTTAVGIGLAFSARGVYADTAAACSAGCMDDASFFRRQSAYARANSATWLVVGGSSALLAGLMMWLWPAAQAPTKISNAVWIMPNGAAGRFQF